MEPTAATQLAQPSQPPVIVRTEGATGKPLLVIHGGAGKRRRVATPEQQAQTTTALLRALDAGMAVLDAGGAAIDAAIAAIHVMEDDPSFNAGHGATLTASGTAELDSCIMLGDGSAGAVAGTTTARNPIDAARAVLEQTSHVLFAPPSAALLEKWGVDQVPNSYFVTPRRLEELADLQATPDGGWGRAQGHGTVGAVARDASGAICAATSTGGMCNQMPGRVGDTPVIGAGTYCNQLTAAISCTGTGEKFVQEVAGYQVHARMLWAGQAPGDAVAAVLEAVELREGNGGIIVVPAHGEGVVGRNACAQMNWGYAFGDVREAKV